MKNCNSLKQINNQIYGYNLRINSHLKTMFPIGGAKKSPELHILKKYEKLKINLYIYPPNFLCKILSSLENTKFSMNILNIVGKYKFTMKILNLNFP